MKKAKIALTAIAVFAIIGGALAIKAKRTAVPLYYKTTATGVCLTQFRYNTIKTGVPVTAPPTVYFYSTLGTSCINPVPTSALSFTSIP